MTLEYSVTKIAPIAHVEGKVSSLYTSLIGVIRYRFVKPSERRVSVRDRFFTLELHRMKRDNTKKRYSIDVDFCRAFFLLNRNTTSMTL